MADLRSTIARIWSERLFVWPLAVFVISLGIFSLTSWERVKKRSTDPHFAYLATTYNSMISAALGNDEAQKRRDGKRPFELEKRPPHGNDWASYWEIELAGGDTYDGIWLDKQGKGRFKLLDGGVVMLDQKSMRAAKRKRRYFVSFPPGPSILMMPLAAVWGYEVNDVLFTNVFAALNVMLIFLLLMRLRERTGRTRAENLWFALLFGFGTVHYWCAVLGQVWFTALVVGATFTLLYLHAAIDARHPLLAGIFAALAFSTRTPLLFGVVFFYLVVLFPKGQLRRKDWKAAARKIALFSAPCLVVGLSLLWMNHLRFGSFSEFGHTYLAGGSLGRIKSYGLFNVHFLSKNLTAFLTLLPRFQPTEPYVVVSKHGMSLLLTTPAFLYLLWPKRDAAGFDRWLHRVLWITVLFVALPAFFYQNTGYEQFGFRFSLDYTPYLVVLLAVGRRPLTRLLKALILAGVAVNLFGAITFKRMSQFYSNNFFP